uniref:Site-specific DNA-methyltransferase n=1 Tax=candidate division WOR-3 bacterium TaxID=2052148 RepID=A0A7C4G9G8_UNCW3
MTNQVTKAKKSQQRFYDALTNLFVGAKVEGESGFINLMRIKSHYFREGVFPALQKEVEAGLKPFPEFREELFDKLYSFFSRYFSESGSIYFRHTAAHQQVYEKVYTDDRDVMLFWKTRMLYYVKTDRLFRSMEVTIDGIRFWFDVSGLEHKKANEKRTLVFEFAEKRKDGVLVFRVTYSERGRKTRTDAILKALRKVGENLNEELLDKAFRIFERQSEVDYFICKDARAFLREQFDLWFYQYVFVGESTWTEMRIRQLQFLRAIALRIIDFIAQFEDELVRIWNKPKFVRNSNYVITLDRIAARDISVVERLVAHPGMKAQVKEWQELGIVDDKFKPSSILEGKPGARTLKPEFQFLPIDTKHFKDLELAILALFDDLDNQLDGWLIKSENYQALQTMRGKHASEVQCIYLDPPYNVGPSRIDYVNDYEHSCWLAFMEGRLAEAKGYLKPNGVVCITIDHVELHRLRSLVDLVLGADNVLGLVCIKSNPSGRSTVKGFSVANEFAVFVGATSETTVGETPRTAEQLAQYPEKDEISRYQWRYFLRSGGANDLRVARPKLHYPLFLSENGIRIPKMEWDKASEVWILKEPPMGGERCVWPEVGGTEYTWRLGVDTLEERLDDVRVRVGRNGKDVIEIKFRLGMDEGVLPKTWWDDPLCNATRYGTTLLRHIMGTQHAFSFPKSVHAVEQCVRVGNVKVDSLVMDYFAGSGTTAHAVINLNRQDGGRRKYILVEMADYFDTVILPRIKKVVFCEKWKNGKAAGGQGISHFVKYFELEQYEDVLRRVQYQDGDLLKGPGMDPFTQYVFMRDLKMLHAVEADIEGNTVRVDLSKLYPDIDLAETLANVLGKHIRRITAKRVYFTDGTDADLVNPDFRLLRPLLWW